MTDPQRIDPERLAALLDGRLGETEAAAVRAQLAGADDVTLSAYADAVAVSAELQGESTPGVVPIESKRRTRRWVGSLVTVAAAAAIAILVVRPSLTGDDYLPANLAAALPAGSSAPGAPVWGATRGAGDGVPDLPRAARAGALLTDLELSVIRGDTARQPVILLANLLEGSAAGMSVSASLRELARSPVGADASSRSAELGRRTMRIVDRPLASAGSYLEAARIASAAGDVAFFDRVPAKALSDIEHDARLSPATRAAVTRVIALTRGTPRDAAAVGQSANELLRELTR